MNRTLIEWTHWSVNPFKMQMPDRTLINVCIHKSDGCRFCYAEGIVRRWWKKEWGEFPGYTAALLKLGTPVLVEDELRAVLRLSERIAKGKADPNVNRVFWNDMTDEYLDFWPDEVIDKLWAIRALTPNLIHQVLTKRADRLLEYMNGNGFATRRCKVAEAAQNLSGGDDRLRINAAEPYSWWPLPNVHVGTSIEDQKTADERIPLLMDTPAAIRWISAEPLLGQIDLESVPTMQGSIDWLVCGGESGPQSRPMHPDWARSLRDQCVAADVPFFFKQWGEWTPYQENGAVNGFRGHDAMRWTNFDNNEGEVVKRNTETLLVKNCQGVEAYPEMVRVGKKAAGRLLDGVEWNQFPQERAVTV